MKNFDEIELDEYEQDIEDNLYLMTSIPNMEEEMALLRKAAVEHMRRKNAE